jgi:hypothetical protein
MNKGKEANGFTEMMPVSNQYVFYIVTGLSWVIDESDLAKGKCTLHNCSRTRISWPSGRVFTYWSASSALSFLLHDVPRTLFASIQLHL